MHKNHSPWLTELNITRDPHNHNEQKNYDVAIIGGGIAGMVTAYYALKNTRNSVILIEATRIAHGATGHNAGQLVDYFEKPFSEIVTEYGLEMAIAGQQAVTGAWTLVEEILKETHIHIPFAKFTGYAGCTGLNQVLSHLENKYLKHSGGIQVEKAALAAECIKKEDIPEKYHHFCEFMPHKEILTHLRTTNMHYIAALHSQKGTMNSALFVEKLSEYLLQAYPDRFAIKEHTPVTDVHLYAEEVQIDSAKHKFKSEWVVLCTNGFENLTIRNHTGLDVNADFHNSVYGIIGYMAGYLETKKSPGKAITYFPPAETISAKNPYFYLTWRNHMWENIENTLVCIGGPEEIHEEVRNYSGSHLYSKIAFQDIDGFLKETFPQEYAHGIHYVFKWHGLMGYTKSGIRSVGPEPANPRLLYNLGCNGVGILPSIYGAHKISHHIAGEDVAPTIFDPIIQKTVMRSSA